MKVTATVLAGLCLLLSTTISAQQTGSVSDAVDAQQQYQQDAQQTSIAMCRANWLIANRFPSDKNPQTSSEYSGHDLPCLALLLCSQLVHQQCGQGNSHNPCRLLF